MSDLNDLYTYVCVCVGVFGFIGFFILGRNKQQKPIYICIKTTTTTTTTSTTTARNLNFYNLWCAPYTVCVCLLNKLSLST